MQENLEEEAASTADESSVTERMMEIDMEEVRAIVEQDHEQ